MDGKPTIKIMSKIQLLNTVKLPQPEDPKLKKLKKFSTRKRGSTPLISTSISIQRKHNNQSITRPRVQPNNFMTTAIHNPNIFSITSAKRLSHCQTAMAMRPIKREELGHGGGHGQKNEAQKLLLKASDKVQKLFWSQGNQNLEPLIVSADFLIDQDSFWAVPKINSNANRFWKELHRNYYVIWIVKFQKGFKILKDYCESLELPLNAVYYQKRQSRLTVDFTPLRKQLNKVYGQELKEIKFIECLKMNTKEICESSSFLGRIPLMFDPRLKVCYIRSEESGLGIEKLSSIIKSLSSPKEQKITELRSIPIFIDSYFRTVQQDRRQQKQQFKATTIFQNLQTEFVDQEETERQVQEFKRQLIETVFKEKGRNFQFQGFSAHYFVGDIVKRNYQLLLESAAKRVRAKGKGKGKSPAGKNLMRSQRKTQPKQLGITQKFYQYYQ